MIPLIIHDAADKLREQLFMQEMAYQGIKEYKVFPAINHLKRRIGISQAHKQCVQYAKDNYLPMCPIFEDDVHFTSPDSWQRFTETIPDDFDIYLGCIYNGEIGKDNITTFFSGLMCYIIHSKFYDTFLGVDGVHHIDAMLGKKGKMVVCNPMVAMQHSTRKNYDMHLRGKKLFGIGQNEMEDIVDAIKKNYKYLDANKFVIYSDDNSRWFDVLEK